jgi:hypothetical protein
MNNYLETAVMKRDSDTLSLIRTRYPPKLINDVRMLLTALRNEESFQKLEKKSPKEIKGLVCARDDSSAWFSNIVDVLVALRRGTSCSRDRTRQRIGVSKLGELSTLLKAASSDEELERYRRGRELLERIRNPSVA